MRIDSKHNQSVYNCCMHAVAALFAIKDGYQVLRYSQMCTEIAQMPREALEALTLKLIAERVCFLILCCVFFL